MLQPVLHCCNNLHLKNLMVRMYLKDVANVLMCALPLTMAVASLAN